MLAGRPGPLDPTETLAGEDPRGEDPVVQVVGSVPAVELVLLTRDLADYDRAFGLIDGGLS